MVEPSKQLDTRVAEAMDASPSYGFTMRGWDFTSAEVAAAVKGHQMLNPAMELGSNVCPWNCDFCFTESPQNPDGRKQRLTTEMPLERRLRLIDEASELGARSINFVGAGEPTIEPGFWQLIDRMVSREIVPIIYTEASLKLTRRSFASRLFDSGATVVVKVNSLADPEYQDQILRGSSAKPTTPQSDYFQERGKALELLMDLGFNDTDPTRLAFDTIICRENLAEIESIHRWARLHNIFVLFVNYLPSGRTSDGHTSAISWDEQRAVFDQLAEIDRVDFGMSHSAHFPYAGGVPCTIRGLGVYVKIGGQVFDCPGESQRLGGVAEESLKGVWESARSISAGFDGECLPRRLFWARQSVESAR